MYHYEALGDERFQEFCQALISIAFPNAQCLPTGQPDGGRDAYLIRHALAARRTKSTQRELIVFQVKYVRHPTNSRDERLMIEDVVKIEKPKIDRLKPAGLFKYYLITNVRGTAHLDVGSIDRANTLLTEKLGIEAYCWWRDDLDRRLDAHSSIKWSYPDILKATDLLEALVAGHLGEDDARRRGAIRAFMTAQYEDDQELKFKQTDLRSLVTDLFVDLPMQLTSTTAGDDEERPHQSMRASANPFYSHRYYEHGTPNISSAEFFVNLDIARNIHRVVLEGAPGQGKSTVTQYICQVMRMKLLDKTDEARKLPQQFQNIRVRIPFRVDLRDLAKWMTGTDPFQSKTVLLDDKEPKSLEGFLAGQVRFASGGHGFSVSDLTAVARASHLFLALDGFDEVADVSLREKLVTEITRGSTRLTNAGGFSVLTIVTSRPAAFAKSIRFPRDQWSYFELQPLERTQVDAYTLKWMKAKGLKPVEQTQLRRILDTKLAEAHTQYLAKNPMQLTILLSLIHNRGASLPEKRTAMYDAYMDMFFSRESEKSDIVRDNRDLLVDIHRYLAWKLQTAAESGENGSIEHNELRRTLLLYLDKQGESTTIVGDLFSGIIERVGALVSRVQETYEFEVQPLREYFAARHLYETAPYSPVGDEQSGTKLDRFDALVRNPYWLNVARFYSGCFSKGEISALVDELSELARTAPYELTGHPRSIALMLLGDWVFTQYQPAVKKVVSFITEQPALRQLLANVYGIGGAGWSALPDRSGRLDLLRALWEGIENTPYTDELMARAGVIVKNSAPKDSAVRWMSLCQQMPRNAWTQLGQALGVFSASNPNLVKETLGEHPPSDLLLCLFRADRYDLLDATSYAKAAQELLLADVRATRFMSAIPEHSKGRIARMAMMFAPHQYCVALHDEGAVPVRHVLERRYTTDPGSVRAFQSLPSTLSEREAEALLAFVNFLETSSTETATAIAPWAKLVKSLRLAWGDSPALDRIAFLGAGIRSPGAAGDDVGLARADCLVSAARFARLKSGAPRWWQTRLESESSTIERQRWLLILLKWGTPRTLLKLSDVLRNLLEAIDDTDWQRLWRDYNSLLFHGPTGGDLEEISSSEIRELEMLGPRLCMFLGMRLGGVSRTKMGILVANTSANQSSPEVQFAMGAIADALFHDQQWDKYLPIIKSLYGRGGSFPPPMRGDLVMPTDVAETICRAPTEFPLPLVAMADNLLRSALGTTAGKLLDVADSESWFA